MSFLLFSKFSFWMLSVILLLDKIVSPPQNIHNDLLMHSYTPFATKIISSYFLLLSYKYFQTTWLVVPKYVQDQCNPVMTAYKLITIDAPYWGFGSKLEQSLLAVYCVFHSHRFKIPIRNSIHKYICIYISWFCICIWIMIVGWEGTFPWKPSELFRLDWWMVWVDSGYDAGARETKRFFVKPGN